MKKLKVEHPDGDEYIALESSDDESNPKQPAKKAKSDLSSSEATQLLLQAVESMNKAADGRSGSEEKRSQRGRKSKTPDGGVSLEAQVPQAPMEAATETFEARKEKKKRKHAAMADEETSAPKETNGDVAAEDKAEKKKRKHAAVADEETSVPRETNGEVTAEDKAEKKRRKHAAVADQETSVSKETNGDVAAEDKAKKRRKHTAVTDKETSVSKETSGGVAAEDKAEKKKRKKEKKEKKDKESSAAEYEKSPSATADAVAPAVPDTKADQVEQWNVGGLGGGRERRDKFLRLLGAKKKADSSTDGGTSGKTVANRSASRDRLDMSRVNSELERQFESGVRMKADAHGHHRGLGA